MKFARDILFIEFETTGPDPYKDFPIQLSAVLLDKDNLLEKSNFNAYIKHSFSQTTNDRIVQTLGIPKETWMKSSNLRAVITEFKAKFPYNIILASHNFVNINFLQESFKKLKVDYEYDYHVIDLWTLGYFYMSRQNLKKIPTAETLGTFFKLKKDKDHDALETLRYHADILRKLASA